MAGFTSEFDSTTFADEEMQHHLLYYFFSLTTDMNPLSRNPQVPVAQLGGGYGVRVQYFLILVACQFPFISSQWLL